MELARDHTFVFVGGLNRSGTTLLGRALAQHPSVSGFRDTPAAMDEGMHLQSVYPPAKAHGGAGRFAFSPEAHLTDSSPLATSANAEKLWREWAPWWDLSCPLLLEKSPPNLIATRFLQQLFPSSRFVMITRHPIAVSLATKRWSKTSIDSLMRHWLCAHDLFDADRHHLAHVLVVRYEDLVAEPGRCLDEVYGFLGIESHDTSLVVRDDANDRYFEEWQRLRARPLLGRRLGRVERHEEAVRRHGYSLLEIGETSNY